MKRILLTTVLTCATAFGAQAANFSFNGTFTQDDNVQRFDFSVGAASTVTLRSYSYAGGTQADGNIVAAGGFDPILALFAGDGTLIDEQDDASFGVPADPVTFSEFDVNLEVDLAIGDYFVTVMQFDNFAASSDFADGFTRDGQGNFTGTADFSSDCVFAGFTSFCDVNSAQRTNTWAFDILNVDVATVINPNPPVNAVPLPAGGALLLSGLALLGLRRNRA